MLDVEVLTPPTAPVTDVVSVQEFARHLRLSPTLRNNADWIANMETALTEALDKLEGPGGELNRSIRPCTLRRYLSGFPARNGIIQLPYPNLIKVNGIVFGASGEILDDADYIVGGELVAEITPSSSWPGVSRGKRAMYVEYEAGYADSKYPPQLKRMVKILAAHYLENPEASINEPRQMAINRATDFGMEDLRASLRVPYAYDDWNE